ncbi:holin family protein [Rhodovulum strictum]|uniref:Carboxylesterase n=1 Tax=Rhodovulum strictum TaxID=58314 RepID=A0A844B615_9RHOB|nr:holin family protein [Rhodovulum strictum]MRH21120.1 carboxylesterase [Rhodovulum strictum]
MALKFGLANVLFGAGRNVITEAVEVFRVNAEASDQRAADLQRAALEQFGHEFAHPQRSAFDRLVDGMNRLPRPFLALGTVFLLVSAMVDPVWFSSRMQGIALVPEPLWWLLGAIISFYFGSRYQAKGQEFQRSIAETMARTPAVLENLRLLDQLDKTTSSTAPAAPQSQSAPAASAPPAEPRPASSGSSPNPALDAWRARE